MDKLFISILNNALVASWIILAVIALRMLFKKTPKWINCLMWVLVAIKLVIPFRIESIFSLIPTANPVPADIEYSEVPRIDTGFTTVNTVINPVLESNFSATETASANPMQVIIGIAAIVWILGVALLIIYGLTSFILLRKKVKDATPASESIYKCDTIESPFIFGIIKPHIFVPETLNECDYACVIEHEKAHIQRRDYIWKPMGFAILAVYWFNPLCWVAYILLCKDIEYACDEKVTKDKDKEWKAKYCQALLNCSSQRRLVSACPVAFGEVSVKDRVKSVLNYKKPSFWITLFSIIACVLVGVFFLTNPITNSNSGDRYTFVASSNDMNKEEKLAQYLEDVIPEMFLSKYDFDSISLEIEPFDDGYAGVMKITSSNVVENDFGAICSGYLDKYLKAYSVYFNESLIISSDSTDTQSADLYINQSELQLQEINKEQYLPSVQIDYSKYVYIDGNKMTIAEAVEAGKIGSISFNYFDKDGNYLLAEDIENNESYQEDFAAMDRRNLVLKSFECLREFYSFEMIMIIGMGDDKYRVVIDYQNDKLETYDYYKGAKDAYEETDRKDSIDYDACFENVIGFLREYIGKTNELFFDIKIENSKVYILDGNEYTLLTDEMIAPSHDELYRRGFEDYKKEVAEAKKGISN